MSPRATPNEAVPMADETIASIIPLHQSKKAKTGAQRARAYRQRKRQKAKATASPNYESPSSESQIPDGFSDSVFAEPPFTPPPTVALRAVGRDEESPSRSISPILLRAAALALAGVGIAMNGSFARPLGSSDAAGWSFLATDQRNEPASLHLKPCIIAGETTPAARCGLSANKPSGTPSRSSI